MKRVAVALSGGGHRAALFGLGVLLYLVDSGKNAQVCSIASVSGGSLTNGYVALVGGYGSAVTSTFEQVAARVTGRIARGTLWSTALTWAYLAVLFLSAAAALVVPWFLPIPGWAGALVLVAALLGVATLAKARGWICARAFRKTLLNRAGHGVRLADADASIEHVFCAADLHTGEHVYLSPGFTYAYRYGLGTAGRVWLHDAVHASAAYPGGFPARRFPTRPHGFAGGADPHAQRTRHLTLVDGGVYDNMADEWGLGVQDRNARLSGGSRFAEPEELVVVNASGAMGWKSTRWFSLPLVGELLTLSRDIGVLYDSTTSTRRRWLVDRFETGVQGVHGALVHIAQTPFRVAEHVAAEPNADPSLRARAHAVLQALAGTEARWSALVAETSAVKTTLSGLGADRAARLVEHGYMLAMANLHVLLDYPLLPVPPAARFDALARGEVEP